MNYSPFKQKETCTHIANTIYNSVDKILTNKGRIEGLNIVLLFNNLSFLKICTYEMYADTDFIADQSGTNFTDPYNDRLIGVFASNLQDIYKLSKPYAEFSELNKYINEVLNSDSN